MPGKFYLVQISFHFFFPFFPPEAAAGVPCAAASFCFSSSSNFTSVSTRLFSALLAFTSRTYHKKLLKLLPNMLMTYLVALGCHLGFKLGNDSSFSFCCRRCNLGCFCRVSSL